MSLQLNAKKTNILVFEREVTRMDVRVEVYDVVLEQVYYLDVLLARIWQEWKVHRWYKKKSVYGEQSEWRIRKNTSKYDFNSKCPFVLHNSVLT